MGSVTVATVIAFNEGALVLFEHLGGIANLKGKNKKLESKARTKQTANKLREHLINPWSE